MYKKLLRNLPFNPSLIGELSLYGQSLRREKRIRGIGLAALVLALIIQVMAAALYPLASQTISRNDVFPGGIASPDEAARLCRENTYDLEIILSELGANCDQLDGASVSHQLQPPDTLMAVGRLPYADPDELALPIGDTTYFARPTSAKTLGEEYLVIPPSQSSGNPLYLSLATGAVAWPMDSSSQTTLAAVLGTVDRNCQDASDTVAAASCLLYSQSTELLDYNTTTKEPTSVRSGDVIRFTFSANNPTPATVVGYKASASLGDALDYADIIDAHGGAIDQFGAVQWPAQHIGAGKRLDQNVSVRIKESLPKSPPPTTSPNSFDRIMTAVYGNSSSSIYVASSGLDNAIAATHALPHGSILYGIGSTVICILIAGFLYVRSALYCKEIDIIRHDFGHAGGRL
jgi:hypothetical protein